METTKKTTYFPPKAEVIIIEPHSVLCSSDIDSLNSFIQGGNEGVGNGFFQW